MSWLTFGISAAAWRHWLTEWAVFSKRWLIRLGWALLEPLGFLLVFGVGLGPLVEEMEGLPYKVYVAPGLVVMYVMYAALTVGSWPVFMKMEERRYEMVLATPLTVEDIVGGELLWGATRGAIVAAACLLVFGAFGTVVSPWALATIPLSFVLGWACTALGLIMTSWIRTYDQFDFMFPLVGTPAFVLSGMFFPVETLPRWAQGLSWLFPTTYAMDPMRMAWRGASGGPWGLWVAALLLVSWALTGAAVARMRRRLFI